MSRFLSSPDRPNPVRRIVCACAVATLLAGFFSPAPSGQGDVTPPTLAAQSPAANATGVSTLIDVTASFSEPIQSATLVMQLRNSGNQLVAATVTYDAPSRTATLNPTPELAGSQTYTVTVSGARDLAGNLMTTVSWAFTTGTAGLPGHRPAADRAGRPHRHPVRRGRKDLRGRKERADLRLRQPVGRDPHARHRSAHGDLQLLGPRHARHGAAPELSEPRRTST